MERGGAPDMRVGRVDDNVTAHQTADGIDVARGFAPAKSP
jgi:hypothetical protein